MAGIHDVRWYHGDMVGMPALGQRLGNANTASKVITVLDACLVTGFNLNTVNSISVTGGVATVTTAANHGFMNNTVIRIAGATPAGLNGDWKVDNCINASFSFPTTVADGAATGTMSAKTAPLGWSKPFVDTNVAVFKGPNTDARYLQVNDPAQNHARIRGFRNMTSALVGDTSFPTTAQDSLGAGILKYNGAATGDTWYLVGDQDLFYLVFEANGTPTSRTSYGPVIYAFGKIPSYVIGDSGANILSGIKNSSDANIGSNMETFNHLAYLNSSAAVTGVGLYCETNYAQTLAAIQFRCVGHAASSGWGTTYNISAPGYPNLGDGSLLLHSPVLVQEVTSSCIRGVLPGTYQPLNQGIPATKHGTFELVNGRNVLFLKAPDTNDAGMMGIDVTGPWR